MKSGRIKHIHDLVKQVQPSTKFLKTIKLSKNENDKKQSRNKRR